MTRSGAMRKDSGRTTAHGSPAAHEESKAKRRAAFIATIRRASQMELPAPRWTTTARPAAGPATGAAARPSTLPQQQPAPASRPPPTAPAPQRAAKPATHIVRAPAATVPAPAPAPAPPPAPAASQPSPNLFRAEALQHRLSAEEGRGVVRVSPPWTWALLWVVVGGVAAAVTASFVGDVEVTGRARGVVRPAAGVRVLTGQLTGTVTRVEARSGERVKAGTPLLRIESPRVQGELLEAERQLEAVETQFSSIAAQQDQHYAEQVQSLNARAGRLREQIASLKGSESHFRRRVAADQDLLAKGLVSEMAVSESRDALAQSQRQLSAAEQALDQTRQELATLESRRQDELWQRKQTVAAARNKRDAVALVDKESVVVAPEDGTVEALLVKVGETVQTGQVLAKVVPVDSPLQVVSFLAEKDRAFAKPGDAVQLELDQLPHSEYGTLSARVVRIGDDLASPAEVRDALGEAQKLEIPAYRVELTITDAHAAEAAGVKLRTGTLLNARFTLRKQRLITLVLSPLRKWFS